MSDKKMLKIENVNRITSLSTTVTDNVRNPERVYPQKPAVLPEYNKCNQTKRLVTPPPPPIAICSSQNNLSSRFAVSSPHHLNQPNSIVHNSNNAIGKYQYVNNGNNNTVNMMPSPTNNSVVITSNCSSPQDQCLPVSIESNFLDMFSFYNSNNNIQQQEQNDLTIYRTPINSPAMHSADNPIAGSELVIDLPWAQSAYSKSRFQNSFHR